MSRGKTLLRTIEHNLIIDCQKKNKLYLNPTILFKEYSLF